MQADRAALAAAYVDDLWGTDLPEQEKLLRTERGLSSRTNPHNHGAISRTWRMQNEAWWRLTSAARAVKKHIICRSTKSVKSNGLLVESHPGVQLTQFLPMHLCISYNGGSGTMLLMISFCCCFFFFDSLTHLLDPACGSLNSCLSSAESCAATQSMMFSRWLWGKQTPFMKPPTSPRSSLMFPIAS